MKNRILKSVFSLCICGLIAFSIVNFQSFNLNAGAVTQFKFNPPSIKVAVGQKAKIGVTMPKNIAIFKSTNTKIAIVNKKTGVVKGISVGTCKIKATTSSGLSGYIKVTVNTPVTFNKTRVLLLLNHSVKVKATAGKDKITYSTTNSKVATVNTSGVVSAVGVGTCKLKATSSQGVTKAIWVNVQKTLTKSNIKYIGHRGAMDVAPENTMASFQQAYKAGYNAIECDIWQTNYNSFVVFHETLADRLGAKITIKKATLNYFKKHPVVYGKNLNKYSKQYIPSVTRVLNYVKKTNMNVYFHIKISKDTFSFTDASAKKLITMIKKAGMLNRVTMFSSNKKVIQKLKPYKVRTGYLIDPVNTDDIRQGAKYAKSMNCKVLFMKYYSNLLVPASITNYCHKNGIEIGMHSMKKTNQVEDLVDTNIDYAICNKILFTK